MTTLSQADIEMPKFRNYQTSDYANIQDAFTKFDGVLYQLSTGGGKSVVISQFVLDRKDKNILIFAHKRKLLVQLRNRFAKLGITTGLMQGQNNENLDANIVIVSIRTAVKEKRLEALLERAWDYEIIDEARHSRTNSYDKVLDSVREKHPAVKLFGVDATPYRKDGKRLDKHFQFLVLPTYDTATLIDKGHLSKFTTVVTPIGRINEEVHEVAGDFQMGELSSYMRQPKFLDYVVNQYRESGKGKQAIAFAVDTQHAKDLMLRFIAGGFTKVARIGSDLTDT